MVRLSGTLLDRGFDCYAEVSSNLMRRWNSQTQLQLPAFLRELFKITKPCPACQPQKSFFFFRLLAALCG
jgi:hypothetical protein